MMNTSGAIVNAADFQRHLNGCERRLNDLTVSLQVLDIVLSKKTTDEQTRILSCIYEQHKQLYATIDALDRSSVVSQASKRLDRCRRTLERNRIRFEHIQSTFDISCADVDCPANDQVLKLIANNRNEIELDLLHQRSITVNDLEKNLSDLRGTFMDLNRIIEEQGIMVDSIEHSLTNTDDLVIEGTQTIQERVHEKQRWSRTKCILLIVIVCIALFLLVLLILFLTHKLAFPIG